MQKQSVHSIPLRGNSPGELCALSPGVLPLLRDSRWMKGPGEVSDSPLLLMLRLQVDAMLSISSMPAYV